MSNLSPDANLMLDESPLIVRMRGSAGFMDASVVMVQSERSQLGASRLIVRVMYSAKSQTFRDLDEHGGVVDKDDLLGGCLTDVER